MRFKDRKWAENAACKGMDTGFFFPKQGSKPDHIAKIKLLCSSCPVQKECREYGEFETHGFWGGVGVRERQNQRSLTRSAVQYGKVRHDGCEVA